MELKEQILQTLKQKPNQLARDIAKQFGVDKKQVNGLLFGALKGQVQQDASYRWVLVMKGKVSSLREANTEQNTNLSKLSRYYLACMGQEEIGVSTFAQSKYGEPDYAVLSEVPYSTNELLQQDGSQRLLGKVKSERGRHALFLGYPTSLKLLRSRKSSWQGYMVEPVLLFALDLDGPDGRPVLDLSYPIINQRVLKAYTNAEREGLMEELAQLESELGLGEEGQLVEIDELALRLQAIRPEWPWLEMINPDNVVSDIPLSHTNREGILNRAVVIMAERSPFTQGLETEIKHLAGLAPGATDGTALGAWLTGEVSIASTENDQKPLLEVLPMNLEQYTAVNSSLSKPLTIITGPPGTGKSQVVTNLLINAAWQGKKVLFASKNNKAVDVVESRINNLGSRPILLRVGAGAYQLRLAEYLMSLMSATSSEDDQLNFNEAVDVHTLLLSKMKGFDEQLGELIQLRNEVDSLEQSTEDAREEIPEGILTYLKKADTGKALQVIELLLEWVPMLNKTTHSFFKRLFWSKVKTSLLATINDQLPMLKVVTGWLGVESPSESIDELNYNVWLGYLQQCHKLATSAHDLKEYVEALAELQKLPSLESIGKRRVDLLHKIATNSEVMWEYWLKLQPSRLSNEDRQMLNRYTALLKMVLETGPDGRLSNNVYREYHSLFPKVSHLLSCWAVTSLSAKGKIPLEPGFFDLVVFDEASQCDIASAIPLLYRAKNAVVIGDPKQLSHISGLAKGQDQQLLDKFGLIGEFPHWAYSVNSLFDLAAGLVGTKDIVSLLDHHRSHSDVIEFSNSQFYENRLRVATRYDKLKRPTEKSPGIIWVDVTGNTVRPASGGALNQQEVNGLVSQLEDLVLNRGYLGSIGVVSPFRAQANAIRVEVEKNKVLSRALLDRDFLVDTVHRFQGDERDVMFFSPVVSTGTASGSLSFLKNNGNLFNVAITRARAQLIVVGDLHYCSRCEIDYLANFAKYTEQLHDKSNKQIDSNRQKYGLTYPVVSNPEQVSDWEKILYESLYKAGVSTLPQFRIEKYVLDLALIIGEHRLDIEIDGERYHRNWTGELCRRDQIRNQRLIELGWDVRRFWVYEIRDDLEGCVNKIKQWVSSVESS